MLIGLLAISSVFNNSNPKPITLEASGVLSQMTIDDKIYASDVIVIGKVEEVLPSKWNTSREINTENLTAKQIIEAGLGIFTDVIVKDDIVLKGVVAEDSTLRVRSFTGRIDNVSFVGSSEPLYEQGKTYLLFLHKDEGPTQAVDPGDYIAVNAINGVYNIIGDKAISSDDEWLLTDLIAYIQASPLSALVTNIPETPEAEQVIKTIKAAYAVEAKAAYDFNTENFSSVFANTPTFVVNIDKLEFIRNFTGNLSLVSPGYLDYKLAHFNWWRESVLLFDALKEKAISENREVTQDELKAIIDSEWAEKWGLAPARAKSPEGEIPLRFISVDVINDTAVVYLHDGFQVVILYVNKVDGQWYIVGDKENTLSETP